MDLIGGILALHLENGIEQSMPNWQSTLPDADRRRRPGSCCNARSDVSPKKLGVSCCCTPTVVEPNLQASGYNQFSTRTHCEAMRTCGDCNSTQI